MASVTGLSEDPTHRATLCSRAARLKDSLHTWLPCVADVDIQACRHRGQRRLPGRLYEPALQGASQDLVCRQRAISRFQDGDGGIQEGATGSGLGHADSSLPRCYTLILSIGQTFKQVAHCYLHRLVDQRPGRGPRVGTHRILGGRRMDVRHQAGGSGMRPVDRSDDILTSPGGSTASGAFWHLQTERLASAAVLMAGRAASPLSGL